MHSCSGISLSPVVAVVSHRRHPSRATAGVYAWL